MWWEVGCGVVYVGNWILCVYGLLKVVVCV